MLFPLPFLFYTIHNIPVPKLYHWCYVQALSGRVQKLPEKVIVPMPLSVVYNLFIRVTAKTSYFRIDTQETRRLKILMFSMFVMKKI